MSLAVKQLLILLTVELFTSLKTPDWAYKLLVEFIESPSTVAARYGRLTGRCCFCSKELTDERSVSAGYGPVCAIKFGLEWGARGGGLSSGSGGLGSRLENVVDVDASAIQENDKVSDRADESSLDPDDADESFLDSDDYDILPFEMDDDVFDY